MNGLSALIGSLLMAILLIIQSSVFSRISLLQGTADLVLLAIIAWASHKRVKTGWVWGIIGAVLVGYVSVVPITVYFAGYLAAVELATVLRQRMQHVPQLTMLLSVFGGTIIVQGLTWASLRFSENPTSIGDTLNLIVLPSLLLNLLLAIPTYLAVGDLAELLYPQPLEN